MQAVARVSPLGGTISVTNVRAEQSDVDPFFLNATQTLSESGGQTSRDLDAHSGEALRAFPQ